VNPALHQFGGLCSQISATLAGSTIRVVGSGASPHKFRGGVAALLDSREKRMVIKQGDTFLGETADDLTILTPFNESPVGKIVVLTAGCDHLLQGDCSNVHDNVKRFRGHAYVPTKSIFATGLT
jgi:hypothetical protein